MAPNSKKTKVRVLVRLRPERPQYKEEGKYPQDGIPERCVRAVDAKTLEIWNWRNAQESIRFRFNGFFDEGSTQEELYHNSVCPFIPFVLQGQNASVFAYGSTGTGKTYTMVGTQENPGLIPRCVDELFKLLHGNQKGSLEWVYRVSFSYLEIYQEKIRDLLDPIKEDLPIRQDRKHNIFIPDSTEMPLKTFEDFMSTFEKASQQRKTAATKLNAYSSRSHSIVLLKVQKVQKVAPFTKLTGKFYLIDLAGSEDNRRTGNEGIRLKESGAINGSLFALSQVVDALNQGLPRIPYRNSKLTRLLQDSLGGTAHACVIANIAPERTFYADTSNTLNFASKSRTIVNVPFVRRSQDKSVAFKRPSDSLPTQKQKRLKIDEQTTTEGQPKPLVINRPVPEHLSLPAGILSPLRREQQKLQDRLAALERLTQVTKTTQPTTATKKLKSPSGRPPLKDFNGFSISEKNSVDSCQSPECRITSPGLAKEQKSSFSVDTTFRLQIDPLLQESHNNEILTILNTGTMKELRKLQGVGAKRAQLITDWRTVYGPFKQVNDLKFVDGFTDKIVAKFLKTNLLSRITFS